jgi:hypothetical protein
MLLLNDDRTERQDEVLLDQILDINGPEATNRIVEALRMSLDAFYLKYKSSDGKKINYKSIEKADFYNFQVGLKQLNQIQLNQLNEQEKKAFFLNVYNILVIHGFLVYGVPLNFFKRLYFYQQLSYRIGGLVYSLNDIEHGILRANRPFFLSWFRKSFLKSKDPRSVYSMSTIDPRIHFALNCGANSCPAIYLYEAKNIDNQLEMATKAFVNDSSNVLIQIETQTISISKIFQWYQSDFLEFTLLTLPTHIGVSMNTCSRRSMYTTSTSRTFKKQRLLEKWIFPFLTSARQEQVREVFNCKKRKWKIQYLPYDWQVNHLH